MSKADQRDAHRYEVLKRSVVDLGLFRRGSLVRRFMPCGKAGCRCQAASPKLHGPYYQWTRKVDGKTVTVRLSQGEVRLLEEWITNARRLDRLIGQMEGVSLRRTDRLLKKIRQS